MSPSLTSGPSGRLELGLGLVVIAAPLAFLPASSVPFVDVKLVVVLAGAFAIWGGLGVVTSPLALPAVAWVLTVALAAVFGVDRWWSLAGPETTATGFLLLGASAFLLVAGTRVPGSIRGRIPGWLVMTSTAVAAVSLFYRLWPEIIDRVVPRLSFDGGTMGHPAFFSGLMATGIVAAVGASRLSTRSLLPMLVVVSSALAISTKRVGWLALAVGLVVALSRTRLPRPRTLLVVGVATITVAGWSALDALVDPEEPVSGAERFAELTSDSARARVAAFTALGRAWPDRPILGWGPGNTWAAFVSSATGKEVREAGRGYGDAHNFFVESALTTGAVGLVILGILIALTIRQMRRGAISTGWAFGGAAGLGVYHLLQPLNVVLTPLLFLLAGLACSSPPDDAAETATDAPHKAKHRPVLRLVARAGMGVALAGALILSVAVVAASVLEKHGRSYNSEWSLRTSLRLTPGRISAAEALALRLALDGRAGDEAAAREAVELAKHTVRIHPWNPGVRLMAADVHILLNDPGGAATWIERHLARFPKDPIPRSPGLPRPSS